MRVLGSFLLVVICLVCAMPAHADVIRVIQEDGSTVEIDIPGAVQVPPRPAPELVPDPLSDPLYEPLSEPLPEPVPVVAPASVAPDATTEKLLETEVSPEQEGAETIAQPEPVEPDYPRPDRKPRVPVVEKIEAAAPANKAGPVMTGPLTRDQAVQVALDYAPPARRMQILPRIYEGRKVYVVAFFTDNGREDILVDMISGEIVE